MAFDQNGLARIGSSQTGKNGVPTVWQYISGDTIPTMGADGYFNEIRELVEAGDRIFVNGAAGAIDIFNFKTVPETGDIVTESGGGAPPADSVGTAQLQDGAVTEPKITDGNVTKAKLETALQPSHVIKYAGNHTTAGGSPTEAFAVAGVLTTDELFCDTKIKGAAGAKILECEIKNNGQITVVFDIDPGNDHILSYQVIRAA